MQASNLEGEADLTNQLDLRGKKTLTSRADLSETDRYFWLTRLSVIWVAVTVVFLPVKFLNFPLNFELVDIWILIGFPVVFLFYATRTSHIINLTYAIPILVVLVSSLISTFTAQSFSNSLIVISKEIYLFVWFMAVAGILTFINTKDLRWILRIWSAVVLAHGALIIAQFFSPALFRFTYALGGFSIDYEVYRPSGLFILDAAGNANKAAFFQLMGFVPLLLAGFSKRITAILGLFLFSSIMSTGSMGANIAFLSGLVVATLAIAFLKKNLLLVIKLFFQSVFVILLLGGVLYVVVSQNQAYLDRFEKIAVGRFDKSSGDRFSLWQQGIDALVENKVIIWGIGPQNFKEFDDEGRMQLHNDTLAFLVERGMFGVLGLALFAGVAMRGAVYILQTYNRAPARARLEVVVFLAALTATLVESLTHQIFHTRELWLVLALQEAVLYKMLRFEYGSEPIVRPVST